MSDGLRAVLGGERPAGVYRDPGPGDAAAGVVADGWARVEVDGETGPGRAGLLRGLGAALGFPPWYAANFDALADCLRDLPAPTVLVWRGWARLLHEDHQAFHSALDVLAERCADPVGPAFVVLLPGAGPDLSDAPQVADL